MGSHSFSVAVVGGGVFGCAIAFQLARRGAKATLIERDEFGEHASGKNPGNLNPILGAPPGLVPFALESFRLHQALASDLADLGCADYDLRPVRRILLALDESERAGLESAIKAFDGQPGFSAAWLDAGTLMQLEPRLSEEVRAGLLLEGNLSVDSRAFNRALAEGAKKSGATLMRDKVTGLDRAGDRVVGVRTRHAVVACDAVVLATGPWVAETREWLGHELPVAPVKGEMLRMRLQGEGLKYDLTRGMISLYRRGRDECWIGVTRERAGLDEVPTEAGRRQLMEGAARIMPAVAQATLLEHAASLRPMTPSTLPIVGPVPGWNNAYVANGGGIKGILLCAGVGQAMSDLILNGQTSLAVSFPEP